MPSDEVPQFPWFSSLDKIVHLFMYLGFTWSICWSLHAENTKIIFYYSIFLAAFLGVLMEVFQLIMKYGRTFEWLDISADVIGAIIGAIIYRLMMGSFRKEH
jgi:VanZ family protein